MKMGLYVSKPDTEIVTMLLQAGADHNLQSIDYPDVAGGSSNVGFTALMWAIFNKHNEMAKLLIEAENAQLNLQTKDGETALILASQGGNKEVVQFLIDAGADLSITNKDKTASQWAAEEGHEEIVQLLAVVGQPKL